MVTQRKLMTADEFFCLPADGMRHELVRGEVTTSPPARPLHGYIAMEIARILSNFISEQKLGHSYAAETGFWIESDPDTVRAPDFAFFSSARLPRPFPESWEGLVPDLVVEVLSPSDSARQVREKMQQWIRTGARLGIVANPRTRSLTLYRPGVEVQNLGPDETLDGGDVLPGFSCQVSDFFPE